MLLCMFKRVTDYNKYLCHQLINRKCLLWLKDLEVLVLNVDFIAFEPMVRQCIMARAYLEAKLDTSLARQTEGKKNTKVLIFPPQLGGYAHCKLPTRP